MTEERDKFRDTAALAILPVLFQQAADKPNAWGPSVLAPLAYKYADALWEARKDNR